MVLSILHITHTWLKPRSHNSPKGPTAPAPNVDLQILIEFALNLRTLCYRAQITNKLNLFKGLSHRSPIVAITSTITPIYGRGE